MQHKKGSCKIVIKFIYLFNPFSSYTDFNNKWSQLIGHVLGSRHVEQMYSDLALDWHKALWRKGERMTT